MLRDKEGWQSAKPGYITKTIKQGPAAITIHRPVLEGVELAEREKKIVETLSHSLRGYLTK